MGTNVAMCCGVGSAGMDNEKFVFDTLNFLLLKNTTSYDNILIICTILFLITVRVGE
jgi:hypothetical protein